MACLHPIKIINPAKEIRLGGHHFFLEVPCGECAECQKTKFNEWSLRAYYESKRCFDEGGFVIFDTLTYAPKHRPYLDDYYEKMPHKMCFSRDDIRHFMVRLRELLTRKGFKHNHKLKYFLTSEYGTDPRGLHCPHYHILFAVNFDIDPLVFSSMISKCWGLGRTDGVPFQSSLYVMSNRVFSPKYNNDLIHLQATAQYVSKYIMKQSSFAKEMLHTLEDVMVKNFTQAWRKNFEARNIYYHLRRNFMQFHLQSHGFGESALKYNNVDDVIKNGFMTFPSSKGVKKRVPLPTYFSRKLFYNLVKDFRNENVWRLSPLGIEVKKKKVFEEIQRVSDTLYGVVHSMEHNHFSTEKFKSIDFYNFARYLLCFRGVTLPMDLFGARSSLYSPSFDQWLPYLFNEAPTESVYNYTSFRDIFVFGRSCISSDYIGDTKHGVTDYPSDQDTCNVDTFQDQFVITSNTFVDFIGYDEAFASIASYLSEFNKNAQSSFDEINNLKQKFKSLTQW